MSERNRVAVMIFGEQYVIKTTEKPERIKELAQIVDNKMQQLSERHPQLGSSKIAVLCALGLADQLHPVKTGRKKKNKE